MNSSGCRGVDCLDGCQTIVRIIKMDVYRIVWMLLGFVFQDSRQMISNTLSVRIKIIIMYMIVVRIRIGNTIVNDI